MNEFETIARYFAPLTEGMPGALGLKDDAAILVPPEGQDLVLTKDAIVASVHFLPDDEPEDIARKLIRVNISDLAAKGAKPFGYLLATILPRGFDETFMAGFARGLAKDQAHYGIGLLGGDTTATEGPLVLSLTAIGTVPSGLMVRRSGARPGDIICVTGTIGDAGLGLKVRRGGLGALTSEDRNFLLKRFLRPEPRLGFALAARSLLHAAIDVSDGLLADTGHIAEASGVSMVLRMDHIPISGAADRACTLSIRPIEYLWSGDDYEICFTADPADLDALRDVAAGTHTRLSIIGTVEAEGEPVRLVGPDGVEIPFEKTGFQHF